MPHRSARRLLLTAAAALLAALPFANAAPPRPAPRWIPRQSRLIPLHFEANRGQAPAGYSLVLRRGAVAAGFFPGGVQFVVAGRAGGPERIGMIFPGSSALPLGSGPPSGRTNYLLGNDPAQWHRHVPIYDAVNYPRLYPGISLRFYGRKGVLEHDFTVAAGADPSRISFRMSGVGALRVTAAGDLAEKDQADRILLRRPLAYQGPAGRRKVVAARFVLLPGGRVGFALGPYNTSQPLVIDPILVFASYLDGSQNDLSTAVTTDAAGDVLVTGTTTSTDFPTLGAVQPSLDCGQQSCDSAQDVYVAKFDPSGSRLLYATYLGGSSADTPGGIAVDPTGNVIGAGTTLSRQDFPRVGPIPAPVSQYNNSFFLLSLSPDGSQLNYSGTIGGFGQNARVTVDASGNAYLAGETDDPNFLVTPGTLAPAALGYPSSQMFVMKVDPAGNLLYSTIVPGNAAAGPTDFNANDFQPAGLFADDQDQLTIAGTGGDGLPVTAGVVGSTMPSRGASLQSTAGFVLQLNATASAVNFASYVPGTDAVAGLAVDPQGDLFVTGNTVETSFPASANAWQTSLSYSGPSPEEAGFVAELAPGATAVKAATYLHGGEGTTGWNRTEMQAIVLDSQGDVFAAGQTGSDAFHLVNPLMKSFVTSNGSAWDMVLTELSPDLSTMKFSTYLSATDTYGGGSTFTAMAMDSSDHLVVTGTTLSPNFPTTPTSAEPRLPANSSGTLETHTFVAKIDAAGTPPVTYLPLALNFGPVFVGTSGNEQVVEVTNSSGAPLAITNISTDDGSFVQSNDCGAGLAVNASCSIQVSFAPTTTGNQFGVLTLTDSSGGSHTLDLAGSGGDLSFRPSGGSSLSSTVAAGGTAQYELELDATESMPGTFALTCSGAPSGSHCSVSPYTANTAGLTSPFTVSVTTTARSLLPPLPSRRLPRQPWLMLLALLALGGLRAVTTRRRLWPALGFAMLCLTVGCGGGSAGLGGNSGGGLAGTPAGTYTLLVTASNGTVSRSTSLTLIVQ
ncbi:MAG: SBBP repeat-containing protein [Terriglobales bacterium]